MRVMFAAAGLVLLASSGSAFAADCNKGLLWPYVRNPGDCLTDAEIASGKTGVYSGPATGAVDVSGIKAPAQPVPGSGSAGDKSAQCTRSWLWPFRGDDCTAPPVSVAAPAPTRDTTAPAPAPSAQPPKPQAAIAPQSQPVQAAAQCHKGILWPFIRDAGDCPTSADRANGRTEPVAAPAAAVAVAAPAAPATSACGRSWLWPFVRDNGDCSAAPAVSTAAVIANPPQATASCTKGILWPFVREAGDCPTASDQANGHTQPIAAAPSAPPAPAIAAAAPASVAPAAAVPAPVTAASSACSKGLLWPFVRDAGDCPTDADRANGQTPPTPVSANAPAPQPSPAVAAAPMTAACSRSWLWPFVRDSGDCATTAEKGGRQTMAVPVSDTAPVQAAVPAVAIMEPAAPGSPAANSAPGACHKGVLWPFVRDAGDCPTDADRGKHQ